MNNPSITNHYIELNKIADIIKGVEIPDDAHSDQGIYRIINCVSFGVDSQELSPLTDFCKIDHLLTCDNYDKFIIQNGDILVSLCATCGSMILVSDIEDHLIADSTVAIIRPKKEIGNWLSELFHIPSMAKWFKIKLAKIKKDGEISINALSNINVLNVSFQKELDKLWECTDLKDFVTLIFEEAGWTVKAVDQSTPGYTFDLELYSQNTLRAVVETKQYDLEHLKQFPRLLYCMYTLFPKESDIKLYLFLQKELYEFDGKRLQPLPDIPKPREIRLAELKDEEKRYDNIIKEIKEAILSTDNETEKAELEEELQMAYDARDSVLMDIDEEYDYDYEPFTEYEDISLATMPPEDKNPQLQIVLNELKVFLGDKIDDVKEQVEVIDKKVDIISEKLDMLNDSIAGYKSLISKVFKETDSVEFNEGIIAAFCDQCIETITKDINRRNCLNEYDTERGELINSFTEQTWNLLDQITKNFLITAKIAYRHLSHLDDMVDFSSVCLLASKALEHEVNKRFCIDYIKYLCFRGIPLENFPTPLIKRKNNKLTVVNAITLGNTAYILCLFKDPTVSADAQENNQKLLLDYCTNVLFIEKKIDIKLTIEDYAKKIQSITNKYRNPSAHTAEMPKSSAKECLDFLVDVEKFLKTMLESFSS